jgi:hypothetical protein
MRLAWQLRKFGVPNLKPLKRLKTAKAILGRIWRNLARFVGRIQRIQRVAQQDLETDRLDRFFATRDVRLRP